MAEFNPYKLEEEKWTPKNVYEILPPNAVSWTNYQYSEGSDNVDTEAANKSLVDGFVDFFAELLGTAGKILGGAVELGGAVLGGFVDGVVSLIGGIANAIGSIFGGGSSESPNLPLFNPIKTNLEAAIQPHRDKINESWQKTEEILAEQEVLRGQMDDSLADMRDASTRAQEATERAGTAITEAEAASAAAESARQTLEEYNTALNQRITTEFNSAVGRADTAIEKADTLAGELAVFKAQHQSEIADAVGKAEQAVADLATLSPKVDTALDESSAANQKVTDLTPQVSEAADKAGEAFALFIENQDRWNKGVTAALDAQKKVDDNFKKWTDGAAEAIEANKNAIKALNSPQMGTSVIPLMPGTKIPAWTVNADWSATNPTAIKDGDPTWYRFDGTRGPGSYNLVAVDSSLEYDFSVWVHGTTGSVLYVELRDQDGNHAVKSGTITGYGKDDNKSYKYLIENMTLTSGWKKVSTTITLNPGVKFINVSKIYGNHPNGVEGSAYLADMRMVPHVPTQASVDQAQNDAISANTEALKALGKKVLGASLVPYKTPSTQEVLDYAAGKLNYDPWADPEYLDAGHLIVSPPRGRVARANSNQGTKNFTGSYVTVDSNIEYKVKFHTYASTSGSNLYIYMHDQNGDLALAETPFTNTSKTKGGLVHNLTLPAGIKEWSGVIKFKPGTTQVRLGTFFWNHSKGSTTGTQEFGGLEIVPNIPDANVVNELQDNAIRKNTEVGTENKNAIEALRDGLNAAVELGEVNGMLEDLRGELEAEAKKREALQEKIDALQTEMIPRTIVSDDRVTYDDYVKLSRREVTAKGSWAGQLAITYTINSGEKTLVTRKNVPDGTTRSWTFSDGVERVDYWVYQGRQRTILLMNAGPYITGSSFTAGTWGVLAVHKVGKTYGTGKIEWRANLLHADRGTTYRFKIEVNGVEVKNVAWTKQGPLTPLGDGKRTLKFEHEFNLPDDATVRLLGYAYNSSPFNAEVSLLQGTLVYVEDELR